MAPLTAGHAAVDFTQGALPALLPALVARFDLSYTEAGALLLAVTVASSVTQPLFGLASDRRALPWVLPASVAASGLGVALATQAPSYGLAFSAIVLAGLGIAAYHPEGARAARVVAGESRARGMSLFSVGGNVGVAAGPLAAGVLVERAGLGAGWLLALPAIIVAVVLTRVVGSVGAATDAVAAVRTGVDRPRALARLLAVAAMRGYVWYGLIGFVPLYETRMRGSGDARAAALLTLLLAAGAIGTLAMGRVADRAGLRRSMAGSFALVGPLVAVYVEVEGPLGVAALTLAGGFLIATFSVSVVLAQEYLPSRASLAAGLGFGLSIGLGGMLSVVVGAIADGYGLDVALLSTAVVAACGAAVTARLPDV